MGIRAGLAIGAAVLTLAACGDQPKLARSTDVSKAAWDNETDHGLWPFTVDEGVLTCHAPDWVTFTANGTEYALTDDARWLGHYEDVKAIMVKGYVEIGNERQPVPVGVDQNLIERGRNLCY